MATKTLNTDRLHRIRELGEVLKSYGLTGRWTWTGSLTQGYHLRTKDAGGRWVMGARPVHEHYEVDEDGDGGRVVRTDCTSAAGTDSCSAGYKDHQAMDRAVPAFAYREPDSPWSTVVPANEIPIFSVCPEATSVHDPRVYRDDVRGFRSPVAAWSAELDAETVLDLLDSHRAAEVLWAEVVRHEHEALRWEHPFPIPKWTQRIREQLDRPWEPDCKTCTTGPGRYYRDRHLWPVLYGWSPEGVEVAL